MHVLPAADTLHRFRETSSMQGMCRPAPSHVMPSSQSSGERTTMEGFDPGSRPVRLTKSGVAMDRSAPVQLPARMSRSRHPQRLANAPQCFLWPAM
jgi:hypothetical protein